MPFIQSPAKVLLTGANGYFAIHAIKDLLDRGYTVVGTVRPEHKGEELIKLFPLYTGKLTYTVVPDILKTGAFDQVIKEGNFDAVAHAASPVVVPGGTIQDFVKPAIDGTVGILDSIKAYGRTVKRVTIVSSTAAMNTFQKGVKHNELLENPRGKGRVEWWSENEKHVDWDLVTIKPSFMVGEPIHAVTSRDQLSSTNEVLSAISKPHDDPTQGPWTIVHVRDVAVIHSAILEKNEHLGGRRVITVGSEPSWQDMYDAFADFSGVPKGSPGVGTTSGTGSPSWDTSFARELLGRDFMGTKETLVETEQYYRKKGWSFFV
ncbi:NADPH-dependent methylglyoxal reductase GRE2 protein [Rhizoctonia solani]|uniref:NADPH-dependent methylglyoxal reductase GRE2 protein n=1 Tax=Rhizoctonia solani TaxID=456999 RepID=A0A8H8P420_9AGAM|nr:NADPH-dependent methylglyoxal reductase GRE2 protein [Rhizoctonia solani]QRW23237.1 NADPH-dependent methylglyoxal reductase GRE2 protein [Rhizoctonia solani]